MEVTVVERHVSAVRMSKHESVLTDAVLCQVGDNDYKNKTWHLSVISHQINLAMIIQSLDILQCMIIHFKCSLMENLQFVTLRAVIYKENNVLTSHHPNEQMYNRCLGILASSDGSQMAWPSNLPLRISLSLHLCIRGPYETIVTREADGESLQKSNQPIFALQ
ncbi:hypothetical protein V6N13_090143 [Hibiscus sabdariffa]